MVIKLNKLFIGIGLILAFWQPILAQLSVEEKQQIDSLDQIIKSKTTHDTLKAQAYISLSEVLSTSNLDTVIYFCKIAQQISEYNLEKRPNKQLVKSFKTSLAAALNNIGYVYMNKSNFSLALEYYFKSNDIELSNNNKQGLASGYNNIGLIYYDLGDIPLALEYYHKSLKIKEEFGDKKGIAMSFNNIGYVYNNQGDKKLAIDYYNKSLKIHQEIGNKKGIALAYNNIGGVYFAEGNYQMALNYYKQSLTTRQELGDKKGMGYSYHNLAKVYEKQNNSALALLYFQKSLDLRIEVGDKQGEAYSYLELGELFLSEGKLKEAKVFANKGLNIGIEGKFTDLMEKNSELLSKIAIHEGDWKQAFQMHNKALQIHDSVASKESIKAAANQQAKYIYEKEKTNSEIEQAKKDAVANQEKQKQWIITIAISTGLLLVLMFLLVLFKRFKVIKRQNEIIHLQKSLIETKHQEISDSINYAERIQRSFLATKELLNDNLKDYFVLFQPKDVVSGDFYWAAKLPNDNFVLVTADSTGHGVPGAIMSLLNITSLEKAIETELEPSAILNVTRKIIIERLKKDGSPEGGKDGMDCSLIAYDFKRNKLTISAANNPVWIVRASTTPIGAGAVSNEVIEIKPDKMPVGKHDKDTVSFTQQIIDLQKGDVIYALTDGFPDQFGGQLGKKFMSKNLRELLAKNAHLPMNEQKNILETTFNSWVGDLEQVDDVTIIGVRV